MGIDYHVEFDGHYYSVPHSLVGQKLELRADRHDGGMLLQGRRVASHVRSTKRGRAHHARRAHAGIAPHAPGMDPGRLLNWALAIGPPRVMS